MINRRNFIRNSALTAAAIPILKSNVLASFAEAKGLKDLYKGDFYIGAAINGGIFRPNNEDLLNILKHDLTL